MQPHFRPVDDMLRPRRRMLEQPPVGVREQIARQLDTPGRGYVVLTLDEARALLDILPKES